MFKCYIDAAILTPPLAIDRVVYFGGVNSMFYAVNQETGKLVWKLPTGGYTSAPPAHHRGVLYLACHDGYLYAVDTKLAARRGSKGVKWKAQVSGLTDWRQPGLHRPPTAPCSALHHHVFKKGHHGWRECHLVGKLGLVAAVVVRTQVEEAVGWYC